MRKLDYNHSALKQVHRDFHSVLQAYALNLCKNEREPNLVADDLIQDLYEKLFNKWAVVERKYLQHGKSYLFKAMRFAYIDYLRKQRRRDVSHSTYMIGKPIIAVTKIDETNSEDTFPPYVSATVTKIEHEVLKYQVLKSWSYQKIADHLGIPKNTVGTHLRRAKRKLRAVLKA